MEGRLATLGRRTTVTDQAMRIPYDETRRPQFSLNQNLEPSTSHCSGTVSGMVMFDRMDAS